MDLFSSAFAPFTIALLLMALLALFEAGGMLVGVAFSDALDEALPDFAADGAGLLEQALSWLYVGKAPTLILFAAFLGGFGLSGVVLQHAATGLFGAPAPALLAAAAAFALALPVTRFVGAAAARFLPKEETDAASVDTLIGRIALVMRGEARQGRPAEAKVADPHGATLYVLVEPDAPDVVFVQGMEVLLTERIGAVFRAIRNETAVLTASSGGNNV